MTAELPTYMRPITTSDMVIPAMRCGESGPVVLCLHGFPDTHRTFRHLLPQLAKAGFRAIAPTMPGYHPRCLHSNGRYRLSDLVKTTATMIDALDADRIVLLGHDWGAAVGYCLAVAAPERLSGLITVAVPYPGGIKRALLRYPEQLQSSWYMGFFQFRRIADVRVEADNWALLDQLWSAWSPGLERSQEEKALLKAAFREPGVKRAALQYYRDGMGILVGDRESEQLFNGEIEVPTLTIHGDKDGCMGPEFFSAAMRRDKFKAGLDVVTLPEVGHFLHLEDPERFGGEVLSWLKKHWQTPATS